MQVQRRPRRGHPQPGGPEEVAFIQAKEGSAPGEGIQALHIDTPSYNGDILVSNNEKCKEKAGFGGLNIYDVTNPAHPTLLAEGFGDETVTGQGKKAANDIHSIFAWDAGDEGLRRDRRQRGGPDVDIVDITNPKKPALIAEYDLDEKFPQIVQAAPANLVEIFHHDVVVKQIGGRQIMLVSYWDGGYVTLDVTDPKNPDLHRRHRLHQPGPGGRREPGSREAPEGNAHQAEFTKDNELHHRRRRGLRPVSACAATTDDAGTFSAGSGSGTPRSARSAATISA